jgi:hypothetical protein
MVLGVGNINLSKCAAIHILRKSSHQQHTYTVNGMNVHVKKQSMDCLKNSGQICFRVRSGHYFDAALKLVIGKATKYDRYIANKG